MPLQRKRGMVVAEPPVLDCPSEALHPVKLENFSPDAAAAAAVAGAVSAGVVASGLKLPIMDQLQRVVGLPWAPAVARKNASGRGGQITAARYSQVIVAEPRRAASMVAATAAAPLPPPTLAAGSVVIDGGGPTVPRTAATLMPPPPPPPLPLGLLQPRQAATTDARKSPVSSACLRKGLIRSPNPT
ncbi:hypothetical protein Vafri_18953 [Volvox africanus]|uniref:Uncharacterized protein n=1 Tax=Volvox africanus TaxID=51714 RepID=A0A8J4FCC5_9CHLO|nr:hypothetical protein Vafri_18953 [Volvox africanus]